jgi:hypothetical protein
MNMHLDEALRIRLDRRDLETLANGEPCHRDFFLGGLRVLSVRIFVSEIQDCQVHDVERTVNIVMTTLDLQAMTNPAEMKHGINIGPVNLQVDLLKAVRRQPVPATVSETVPENAVNRD